MSGCADLRLHGLGRLLQLGNQLPELGGLLSLGVHHSLGGTGDELLVGEFLLHDAQTVFRLFFLLGNALQLRGDIHQLAQGHIRRGVCGDHAHLARHIRGGGGGKGHGAGIGQTLDEMQALGVDIRRSGDDEDLRLLGRRHVHLRAAGTDGLDGVHDRFHGGLFLREGKFGPVDRPLGGHQVRILMGQRLVDLLGDEGHEGMQQLQKLREHVAKDVLSHQLGLLVLAVQPGLGQLDIPIAVGVPQEVVDLGGRHADLVAVQILRDLLDQRVQLGEHPLVLSGQLSGLGQDAAVDGQVHHDEPAGVPDLVCEVAHGLALFRVEPGVVSGAVAGDEVEAQGVGTVLLRHLQRVDAVAQRLGHLAALVVPHQAMDEHRVERDLLHLLTTGEDHPGHPEEDDVVAGDHDGGGIEIRQVLGLFRPAQRGEGPQGGGEPGIQHVRVAGQVRAAALFALGGILPGDIDVAALVAVPGGDLVAPPKLTGDAPVVDVLHPVGVGLGEALGDELDFALLHHAQCLLGKGLHLHEPLGGDQGLHVVVAAVAGAHVVVIGLGLDQISLLLQIFHDLLAALVTVHTVVGAAVFVDLSVIADAADDLQIVAQAHLKVVGVVGGGHLHGAGTEAQLHVVVRHDGDLPVHDGQDAGLAHQMLEPLVLRVHGNARIAHHGLGTGGSHHQVAGAVRERIADVPQVAGLVQILHLRVGKSGGTVGAPVDDAAALVDEALVVELAERLTDGLGAALVHGEAGAVPIAGDAHLLLLFHDAAAVLLLPLPDPLEELLAAQVVTGLALLDPQIFLHLDLGGDAGVVGAGHPQGGVALHPLEASEDVLQRAVQGVAHVQLAGDIGRGHHDGKGLFLGIGAGAEAAGVLPHLIDAGLYLLGFIHLRQFFFHTLTLLFFKPEVLMIT